MTKEEIREKILSQPVGQLIDDLKDGFEAAYNAGDIVTATEFSNEIIVLRRITNDLIGIEYELNGEG